MKINTLPASYIESFIRITDTDEESLSIFFEKL